MSRRIKTYNAFVSNADNPAKAGVFSKALEVPEKKHSFFNLDNLAVNAQIRETELCLQKEIKETELRLQKEIEGVSLEIKKAELSLQKHLSNLFKWSFVFRIAQFTALISFAMTVYKMLSN